MNIMKYSSLDSYKNNNKYILRKKYPYNCFGMTVYIVISIIADGTSVSTFLRTRKLGPEEVIVTAFQLSAQKLKYSITSSSVKLNNFLHLLVDSCIIFILFLCYIQQFPFCVA